MKMRKLTLLALSLLFALGVSGQNTPLEDTALVRISTPVERAEFLNRLMREKLGAESETVLSEINFRYEALLEEVVLQNPPPLYQSNVKKDKDDDPFYQLSEARYKEVKKALSRKEYKEYVKSVWGWRNMLTKEIVTRRDAENAEEARLKQEKLEQERIEKEKAEEEARKAQEEEEAKASKKKSSKNSKKGSSNKKSGKKRS